MKLEPNLYTINKTQSGGYNGGANSRLIGENHTILFLKNIPNPPIKLAETPTEKRTPFEFTEPVLRSEATKFTRDFLNESEAYERRKEIQEALKFDFNAIPMKSFMDRTRETQTTGTGTEELSKSQMKPVGATAQVFSSITDVSPGKERKGGNRKAAELQTPDATEVSNNSMEAQTGRDADKSVFQGKVKEYRARNPGLSHNEAQAIVSKMDREARGK